MSIPFTQERWARVKENNRLWRARKLGRPLIQWKLWDADSGPPEPALPPLWKMSLYDTRYTVDQYLTRLAFEVGHTKYIGDAFPSFWPNFGPGIVAEYLGGHAAPTIETHTVWFHPGKFEGLQPKDIHLEFSLHSQWLERLLEMCRKGIERFEGNLQISMTDLGGTLDILASLRPAESLLTDLYDCPLEIERLMWEAHDMWFKYFDLINGALKGNPGYSSWSDEFSCDPAYMLQCDFCYMLSPEMFDRFVLPELAAACGRLTGGAFFHQDGIGQLPHTKSLHSIPTLAGIQWQPGSGDHPPSCGWFDQQRRIRDDGKLSQTWGGPDELEALANNIGDVSNIVIIGHGSTKDEARYREVLRKFNAEE